MPADDDGSITGFFERLRAGEAEAARRLWERFLPRLRRLAQMTLAGRPQRVADADDAMLSAFASFWQRAERGDLRGPFDRDDLWNLLGLITVRKALKQVRRERAEKRGGGRVRGESELTGPGGEELRVAIKVPRPGVLETDHDVERFLREARATSTIHHPNICPVYEAGQENGGYYIVMALVPGKSLAAYLDERKEPLPQRQAALIVRKLALALQAAHAKGIVHRDLKPANVMLDLERREPVVMDFGLARRFRSDDARLTHSGMIVGTPAYMSPEQARGDVQAVVPKEAPPLKPTGDWNTLKVEAVGPRLKVSINGNVVNDVDLSKVDRSKLAPRKKGAAEANLDRKSGRIGLQSANAPMKFRNIRVKDLSK